MGTYIVAAEETVKAINDGTMVSFGLLITLVTVMFYFGGKLTKIELTLKNLLEDRWSRNDHRFWVSEVARLNPELNLPNVESTKTVKRNKLPEES